MKYFLLFIAIAFTGFSQAQTGTISGALSDKEAGGSPLPFANIIIKGTSKGTTSDFDGNYILENVDPGSYVIEISFIGYKTLTVADVVVTSGQTTLVNGELSSEMVLDDVIITGTTAQRESESALLLDQKKATTIKQSIGADELARKGVSNAAAAVTKISGISKQEGGGNVYVRGLGDRYLNTTYNGLTLPANNIEKKNMDLGLFSSDAGNFILVFYSFCQSP